MKIRLKPEQKKYAKKAYQQITKNGVALLQLPTGQGKTLIALKVVAEILYHSKNPRSIVLVTRKKEDEEDFKAALFNDKSLKDINARPWIRDSVNANGLTGFHRSLSSKIGQVRCYSQVDLHNNSIPQGTIVIIDEIHRFQSFLENTAEKSHQQKKGIQISRSKQRKYLFLSATPINPTRISENEERGNYSFEEQEKKEDQHIKTSYLNLYKTMIALSFLSQNQKNELLNDLNTGTQKTLEEFSESLRKVMKVLKPIPKPEILIGLGPRNKKPTFRPVMPKINASNYCNSVQGLLKFHESIIDKCSLFYCAERMALSGVKSKRSSKNVGFQKLPNTFAHKGLFHYQPNTPYENTTCEALRIIEKNNKEIRNLLYSKIDALYIFLYKIWKAQLKRKWKVLIYCAYRGSVAALAAELEKRFYKDGIVCRCNKTVDNGFYGKHGSRRVVWDTEGYFDSQEVMQHPEKSLIDQFCCESNENKYGCNKKGGKCPQGFVLVTSDRLSESYDLHHNCEIMIHFDLDWSPLRMIQRYGRLWRIESDRKLPKVPAVFHLIQPGSVDDEIDWRLKNRWEKLKKLKLGLDMVGYEHALGKRIY